VPVQRAPETLHGAGATVPVQRAPTYCAMCAPSPFFRQPFLHLCPLKLYTVLVQRCRCNARVHHHKLMTQHYKGVMQHHKLMTQYYKLMTQHYKLMTQHYKGVMQHKNEGRWQWQGGVVVAVARASEGL